MHGFAESIETSPHTVAIAGILSDGKPHKAGDIASSLQISTEAVRRHVFWMRDEIGMEIHSGRTGFLFKGEQDSKNG